MPQIMDQEWTSIISADKDLHCPILNTLLFLGSYAVCHPLFISRDHHV